MDTQFDIILLGGGPGGYVAAIRAAQLGMKAAVVERETLGGICLNWGCIPTKALLRSAEINHLLHHLPEYGFAADNIRFDLPAIVKRSRGIAKQLSSGVTHLLKKNKIPVFMGQGRLAGAHTLAVTIDGKEATLTAPHIILATGARAAIARPGERRQPDLVISRGDGSEDDAEIASGRGLGRNRDRVCELLPQHGCRGDDRRSTRPYSAIRG